MHLYFIYKSMIHYIFMKETHQTPRQQTLNQFYIFFILLMKCIFFGCNNRITRMMTSISSEVYEEKKPES